MMRTQHDHDHHQGQGCCGGKEEEQVEKEEEEVLDLRLGPDGRIAYGGQLSYECRSFSKALDLSGRGILPRLLRDCERAFTAREQKKDGAYSEGSTFFLPADMIPRTTLEYLAKDIFDYHTQGTTQYDPKKSGAEWWALVLEEDDDVGPHFDKDYSMEDHGLNICPQIATVTYLSDVGGPTLVLAKSAPLPHGAPLQGDIDQCFLSRPCLAKHISFDGRHLHAAPSELRPLWRPGPLSRNKTGRKRVSFLVNIWLNFRPCTAEVLDEATATAMGTGVRVPFMIPPASVEDLAIATYDTRSSSGRSSIQDLLRIHRWKFSAEGGKYWLEVPVPGEEGSFDAGNHCVRLRYNRRGAKSARLMLRRAGDDGEGSSSEDEDGGSSSDEEQDDDLR